MIRRTIATLVVATVLAGCTTAPGTGWSRAPDLSIYSAMTLFGQIAREQESLCRGFDARSAASRWNQAFAGREQAVSEYLAARHGQEEVARALAQAVPTRVVPCPDVPDRRWRNEYVDLLRLLEARLGLA